MSKIKFIYFLCARDLRAFYYSYKSIIKFFSNSEIHLIIDENIPIILDDKNVKIHISDFSFGNNLNGFDFILNQFKIYKQLSKNCDYICKIDSDVMMFGDEFKECCFQEYDFIARENLSYIENNNIPTHYGMGGFYLLRSSFLNSIKNIEEKLDHINSLYKNEENNWKEDEFISLLVRENSNHFFLQKGGSDHPILGFWPYSKLEQKIPIEYFAQLQNFDCVEFGRTFGQNHKGRDNIMKRIYNFYFN